MSSQVLAVRTSPFEIKSEYMAWGLFPILFAAQGIGDVAHPSWRASAVGVYRFWRDASYAFGAILAGITADLFGVKTAVWLVAGVTFWSGVVVALRMRETKQGAATKV